MALMIFVPLIVLVGVASSAPTYTLPLTYVALSPIPENIYNQVQDTKSGEYAFGYAGGPVAREEARTSDGVTRGAYSYVDAHGIVQYYRYVADDDGFHVVGTNIPMDATPSSQPQLEAVKVELVDTEPILAKSEAAKVKSVDLSEKTAEGAVSRKKRSAVYVEAPALPTATLVGVAEVPTAISSQSREQIHKSLKTEIQSPIEATPVETVAAIPVSPVAVPVATPVVAKSVEAVPVAAAASIPTATSSQSRFQIHDSLKTEIHSPVEAISVEPIAPAPVAVKNVEAIPLAVAASVPTSTSSQSRFQIHSNLKTEIHSPVEAISVEPIAAAPVAVKSVEAIPLAVAASVPTSTSSQSRFQIHSNLKAEIHSPIEPIPVVPVAAAAKAAEAVPVAAKSIEAISIEGTGEQTDETPKPLEKDPVAAEAIPALPASPVVAAAPEATETTPEVPSDPALPISTSDQRSLQIYNTVNDEIVKPLAAVPVAIATDLGNRLNIHPPFTLNPASLLTFAPLTRHQIGVGLGVLPSPVIAYRNYAPALIIDA